MQSRLGQIVLDTITSAEYVDLDKSSVPLTQVMSTGNSLQACLLKGECIFPAAARLIENAQSSVEICTYTFQHDSDPARCIGAALRRAMLRRQSDRTLPVLNVRILADHVPVLFGPVGAGRTSLQKFVQHCALNPTYVRLQIATHSHNGLNALHCKYFIIDSAELVITGDNLYAHSNFTPASWNDAGFEISGSGVSSQVRLDFKRLWNKSTPCSDNWTRLEIDVGPTSNNNNNSTMPIASSAANSSNSFPILVLSRIESNSMLNWQNSMLRNSHNQAFLAVIYHALHSLDIMSPNINSLPFQLALIHALKRGIKVRMLISGCNCGKFTAQNFPFQGGDSKQAMHSLYTRYPEIMQAYLQSEQLEFKWFALDGVTVNMPRMEGRNHSKLLLADNAISIVGSGNMDSQSWRHSAELNLLLDSEAATQRIREEIFDRLWSTSVSAHSFPASADSLLITIILSLIFLGIVALSLRLIWKRTGKDREAVFLSTALIIIVMILVVQVHTTNIQQFMFPWPIVK
jgi:phosphatidylserine/phosphatidylglycerophosphate/cardiolipin synthase-like enzyme